MFTYKIIVLIVWALVALCLFYSMKTAAGFTELTVVQNEACVGEDVILLCATSSYILMWEIVLEDRNVPALSRFFQGSHLAGKSYSISDSTSQLHLDFELVSNSMGTLNTSLVIHTTTVLNNAVISCEGTSIEYFTFQLTRMPNKPNNITVIYKTHEVASSNVTLSWSRNSSNERADEYYSVYVTYYYYDLGSNLLVSANVTTPSFTIQGVPYDQLVVAKIKSINCYSESEEAEFNITINKCNNTLPQNIRLVSRDNSSSEIHKNIMDTSNPGEEIVFTCNSGYSPQNLIHMTALCQETGTWNPEPSEIQCLAECELPSLNNLTEIVNVSAINGTIAGSKMVIGCRKNYGWTMDSICSEEGLWEPNPEEYIDECITQDIQQLYQENQRLIVILTTSCAAGSILTCSLISVCTLCMCIVKVYKKRFKLPEEVLEIQRIEPVYETIEPAYAVIVDHEQICETNFNNAYNV